MNALRIINYGNPERIGTRVPMELLSYHGGNHEGYQDNFGDDHPVNQSWQDIWGTIWCKKIDGVMGLPIEHPLDDQNNLANYIWPDSDDERICEEIYSQSAKIKNTAIQNNSFLAGSHRDLLWEKAYMLGGMENMMVRFITDPEFMKTVLFHIMNFQLGIAQHYINAGVEMVKFGDDLGSQHGSLLGPKIFKDFIKPEYKRIFDFYKSHDVMIYFHSCGDIESLIEDFIELGVNILNPVQATANDLDHVRKLTQGRIALEGGVNSDIVYNGPVSRIKEEVKTRMIQLGSSGGYFCCPDQRLPYPDENLKALYETVKNQGKYPLNINV